MSARIRIAHVRDPAGDMGGGAGCGDAPARLLVDRLWPRGIRKADLHLDAWLRDIAPSTGLRKWFAHDPAKWPEFRHRYRAELDAAPQAVAEALDWCARGPVLLLFDAHDAAHNNAVALRDYLSARLDAGGRA